MDKLKSAVVSGLVVLGVGVEANAFVAEGVKGGSG